VQVNQILKSCSALVAAALILTSAGLAAAPEPAPLTAQDQAELQRIAAYLNNIHTMYARYRQTASGRASTGQLWLLRPGRMRFEYDAPNPLTMFADGTYIYLWDKKLNEVSKVALMATPAWFLLRNHIGFDDVIVTGIEHGPNTIRVTVVQKDKPDAGSLTMTFTENPLALTQWSVVDQEGKTTQVSLSDVQFGIPVDPKIFVYQGG
jgi:outer membrane lipoprotein-sorting protein